MNPAAYYVGSEIPHIFWNITTTYKNVENLRPSLNKNTLNRKTEIRKH